MSYFKAKMHQIQFRLSLRPRPRFGAYSAPETPLAEFKGGYFSSRGKEWKRREGRERKGPKWTGRKEVREGEVEGVNIAWLDL